MIRKLPIPDGQRTKVFRQILEWLMDDPVLRRALEKSTSWKTFSGNPSDAGPLEALSGPAIRLSPAQGPMAWVTVDSMEAPLYINIECCVRGLHADDVMNLQEAIENALYPADQTKNYAMRRTLQNAPLYCITGLIEFSMPVYDRRSPEELGAGGNWYPVGQLRIDIRRTFGVA